MKNWEDDYKLFVIFGTDCMFFTSCFMFMLRFSQAFCHHIKSRSFSSVHLASFFIHAQWWKNSHLQLLLWGLIWIFPRPHEVNHYAPMLALLCSHSLAKAHDIVHWRFTVSSCHNWTITSKTPHLWPWVSFLLMLQMSLPTTWSLSLCSRCCTWGCIYSMFVLPLGLCMYSTPCILRPGSILYSMFQAGNCMQECSICKCTSFVPV